MALICLPLNLLKEFLSILIRSALFNFSPKTKLIYIFTQAELVNSNNDYFKNLILIENRDRYRLNDTDKRTQKRKKSKKSNTVVNAGPPDIEYLYYPLDVEGVTLKGSLLPASTR